jgi:geranylgeranylglycerol-phosphate geranylgeranyltransferase
MASKKIKGMIRLFRPDLSMAAGVCVLTGQVLATGTWPPLLTAVLGFVSLFAISGSALILNDYFDIEVDKVNAPERPLPSGAVTPSDAIWLAVAASILGLATALVLGYRALILAFILWVISFLYNWRFKQSGLPGNLIVCASVALSFIFGALSVDKLGNNVVWTFSLMAFFLDLGEEIAGDAMDMEGDRKRHSRSIALSRGKPFALTISLMLWSIVVLLSLLPYFMNWMGISYLVIILITDIILVFFSIRLVKSQTPEAGRKAMRGIYMGATLGLIAFLLGQIIK